MHISILGLLIIAVLFFAGGMVVEYLIFRNNPKIKAALDKKVDAVSKA